MKRLVKNIDGVPCSSYTCNPNIVCAYVYVGEPIRVIFYFFTERMEA